MAAWLGEGIEIRYRPYLAAAARLHVLPENCVVVEDAPAGLAAARAAGMRSIGVVGTCDAAALAQATITIPRLAALRVVAGDADGLLTIQLTSASERIP